jgi:hypothetical protein
MRLRLKSTKEYYTVSATCISTKNETKIGYTKEFLCDTSLDNHVEKKGRERKNSCTQGRGLKMGNIKGRQKN